MVSFKGKHFEKTIIMISIRWYVAYSLSYRNIEELLKERVLSIDHATINKWVIKYSPLLEKEFRKKHKQRTGLSWRMDETYVKNRGEWNYLYRALDKQGKTIDFMLSAKRVKSLNNIVEQDHRHIKRIIKPTLGFKSFVSAKATIAGIELHHMLKKEQMIVSINMPIWKQFYTLAG